MLERGGGYAIEAEARHNTAVYAITRSTRNLNDPHDPTVGLDSAVHGADLSTNVMNSNQGVLGTSLHATGVQGVTYSTTGNFGVYGEDGNPATTSGNVGIEGISSHNVGVLGRTNTGVGMYGFALGTGAGVAGFSSGSGAGVVGFSLNGNSVEADGFAKPSLVATTVFGMLFQGFTNVQGKLKEVASLDSRGNLILAGNLTTGGTPQAMARTVSGRSVVAYLPRQAAPTIEDVGESQLRFGFARVRIDPAFAQAMDTSRRYMVFITPNGDSNSLYVTLRAPSSFDVRESKSGQSNTPFSYRIVATPFGSTASRLPSAAVMSDQAPPTSAGLLNDCAYQHAINLVIV